MEGRGGGGVLEEGFWGGFWGGSEKIGRGWVVEEEEEDGAADTNGRENNTDGDTIDQSVPSSEPMGLRIYRFRVQAWPENVSVRLDGGGRGLWGHLAFGATWPGRLVSCLVFSCCVGSFGITVVEHVVSNLSQNTMCCAQQEHVTNSVCFAN